MKGIARIGLATLFGTILATSVANADPAKPVEECLSVAPLPENAIQRIAESDRAVGGIWQPGAWYGTWHTIADTCHIFLVLSVDGDDASVIYSYAEYDYPAGYEEIEADIGRDGALRFSVSWGAELTYRNNEAGPPGSLIATYSQRGSWDIVLLPIDMAP